MGEAMYRLSETLFMPQWVMNTLARESTSSWFT